MTAWLIFGLWLAAVLVIVLWFRGARSTSAVPGPGETLRLGGRRFVVCEYTTVAQDSALAQHLAAAGLDPFKPVLPEGAEEAGVRVFAAIHQAGLMLPILGCILLPAELAGHAGRGALRRLLERWGLVEPRPSGWTPAVAAATAGYLGELDEPGEKRLLYAVFAQAIVPFYVAEIGSSRPSPASSQSGSSATRDRGSVAISAPGEA